jgi:hypothetical protein
LTAIPYGVNYLDVNKIDDVYFWEIQVFMIRGIQGAEHVWLVMMKAMRALTRYAAAGIEETGLGLSDFAVLEVLPRRAAGPQPNRRRVAFHFSRTMLFIQNHITREKETP